MKSKDKTAPASEGCAYGQQFFRSLTARILRRCGLGRHLREFLPETQAEITQFELWDGMREMADYLSRQGCQSFSRTALYHEPSRPLTSAQVESDLVELAVWYAGRNGYATRLGQPFPQSAYEEGVLLALFFALISCTSCEEEFGPGFESNIRIDSKAYRIHQAIHGRTPKERWEGYAPLRMWISGQALELLEKFLVSLSVDERSAFKDFLDEWTECWHIKYMNDVRLMRIVTMYFASRAGHGRDALIAAAWPPLLEIVPPKARQRRGEDPRELLTA